MSTRIQLTGITKIFGTGRNKATAVDNITTAIEPGELFFLLGPSGCGKTTLLRMIAGFIEPNAGTIAFDNKEVTNTPPNKRNTGMVFQSYALWPHMTVEQNVAFGLNVRKTPATARDRAVMEALDAVQMAEYAKRKPNQLSGGQQQRIALARALVIRPAVLLLDEPLSNLDAKLRTDLRSEIRKICKSAGLTTVYVTHDQKEALSMADRIAIMRDGQIQQIGTPQDLYRNPQSQFIASFLGETNFVEAKVLGPDSVNRLILETAAGKVIASITGDSAAYSKGQRVMCSIRPESIQLVDAAAANTLPGKRLESVYLGEIAQHQIRMGEQTMGQVLAVSELNPTTEHLSTSTTQVGMRIDPRDIVILPHNS